MGPNCPAVHTPTYTQVRFLIGFREGLREVYPGLKLYIPLFYRTKAKLNLKTALKPEIPSTIYAICIYAYTYTIYTIPYMHIVYALVPTLPVSQVSEPRVSSDSHT